MKKILLSSVIVLASLTFNSCTDNTLEELEIKKNEEIQFIDKEDIDESPDTRDD
ncbi:hypothetical protein [Tenacibaculum sp. 190524A02b]|uniref:hypothetical protein n=1 Tax=Tenacibaculum vairaonense TaxID=3137860 RepID=UPI0031FB218C